MIQYCIVLLCGSSWEATVYGYGSHTDPETGTHEHNIFILVVIIYERADITILRVGGCLSIIMQAFKNEVIYQGEDRRKS